MATIASGRTAPNPDNTTSHPYSCNTCQVAFRNSELQKSHMKGDWHRYNLKRRVASLPPIPSELFADKVMQSRATTTAEADRASFERVCTACQKTYFSENSYRNHVSSQKHKTRQVAIAARGPLARDDASSIISSEFSLIEPNQKTRSSDVDSQLVDSDAEEEFTHVVEGLKKATLEDGFSPLKRPPNPRLSAVEQRKGEHPLARDSSEQGSKASRSTTPTQATSKTAEPAHSLKLCLFCNYSSPTVALSVAHMERFHGMFIPEKQYLVDLDGLLSQLEKRIRDDHECIYCGKIRNDVFAVQTHMRDKAHCKIPYMSLEEQVDIGDYYDFRGTYSDSESDAEEKKSAKHGSRGSAKLGAKRSTTTAGAGDSEDLPDAEDDSWETDSWASSLDSADLTAVRADNHLLQYERLSKHPHHSQTDPRTHHQADGWHSHAHKHNHAVFYDEYELHLPSGRSVGHRSLNRYYRQNLHNYPSMAEQEKQMRLAIQAGVEMDSEGEESDDENDDAMDVDGGAGTVARTSGAWSRAVAARRPPRNTMGLAGVGDKTKEGLRKSERRAIKARHIAEDKGKVKYSAKSIGMSFQFLGR